MRKRAISCQVKEINGLRGGAPVCNAQGNPQTDDAIA
jgi:hypothetical protein